MSQGFEMGLKPCEIKQMTLADYIVCAGSFAAMHGLNGQSEMMPDEYSKLVAIGEKWNKEANGKRS